MNASATRPATMDRDRSQEASAVTSEWDIDRLDIDAYRDRIGYQGPLEPALDVLLAIHRAHAAAIPFENLNVVLGRGVSLDMGDIQDKLLRSERGGYCYEHNLLFAALLERAGFTVQRLVARLQPDKPGPRTHMLLNVTVDGQPWLADVGFGATLLEPIPLIDGVAIRQGAWIHGVRKDDDGSWRLRTLGSEGWSDLYAFTQERQCPIDYAIFNHYTSTHSASPFVGQVVAMRVTSEERFTLRQDILTRTHPDGESEQRQVPGTEVVDVLRDTFGIALDHEETTTLLRFLTHAPVRHRDRHRS